ncbi:MAG: sigma-54-dependent Fis family transcriptional regulator [Deltaproteobacteria bacterium]|nr:sigma-54-dependent Fis family transcriptional regulator [Deltaproteobacteria bacterium]MBN2671851.1 sigma-54-dependent Fis family transcriptional regulator [Deltaproteobacteria bacterium]
MSERSSGLPVLLVDDEQTAIDGIEMMLESEGIEDILSTTNPRQVMDLLSKTKVSAVLLDLSMPHMDGRELLSDITRLYPETPVIIVTGYNEVEIAIECMKAGAFDYIVKPVDEARLSSAVKRAVSFGELQDEYASFKKKMFKGELEHPECFAHIVTANRKMRAIFNYVETIAHSRRPVLITGETGVGKELFAKAVHAVSRSDGPFVTVNVAGLDDQMFSDTLFGHQKGAFTGADTRRPGLIETAKNGTLFLDEIGDLDMTSQVKLLRLLQENEYFPLGADAPKPAEARIVVATNQNLQQLQEQQRFRTDLYFRLQTHHVQIPPLRERLDDIPILVHHFINKAATDLDKKRPTPPKELSTLLSTYHFPGNVRELEAMVFDAVSNHKSKVLSTSIFKNHIRTHTANEGGHQNDAAGASPALSGSPLSLFSKLPTLTEARELLIEEALRRAEGNHTVASQMIGISRSGLSKALSRRKHDD